MFSCTPQDILPSLPPPAMQQILELFFPSAFNATTPTSQNDAVTSLNTPQDVVAAVRLLLSSDWVKLAIFGAFLEFARRSWSNLWATLVASCFITAHFEGDDEAYDWMMIWLAKRTTW